MRTIEDERERESVTIGARDVPGSSSVLGSVGANVLGLLLTIFTLRSSRTSPVDGIGNRNSVRRSRHCVSTAQCDARRRTVDAALGVLVVQDEVVRHAQRMRLSPLEQRHELLARHARRKVESEAVYDHVFVDLERLRSSHRGRPVSQSSVRLLVRLLTQWRERRVTTPRATRTHLVLHFLWRVLQVRRQVCLEPWVLPAAP